MLRKLRSRWRLRRILRLWIKLRDAVMAERKGEAVTPKEERAFLALKVALVRLLPNMPAPSPGARFAAAHGQFGGMLALLGQFERLPQELSEEERETFSRAWQEIFLSLNQLQASAFGTEGATRKATAVPTGMRSGNGIFWRGLSAFFKFSGIVARAAILVTLVYLVMVMTGMHVGTKGDLSIQPPTSVSGSWQNLCQGATNVWAPLFRVLAPVEAAFGSIGVLLAAVLGAMAVGYVALRS